MGKVRIGDLFELEKGSLQSSKCTEGEFDFITASKYWKTHNDFSHEFEALIFAAMASGSLGRTHYVNGKFITSDLCYILTPKNSEKYPIDIKFYHFVFNSLKDKIVKNTKSGTSKEAINQTNLKNYEIPYFGIEQQHLWIEKLLKTKSIKENLTVETETQETLLKKLRQIILQDAIEGKLTTSWREQNSDVESASILLEKIKAEKEQLIKDKKIKKQKPLPSIKEDEIPFSIPDSWVWCRLDEISLIGTGATPLTSNNEYYKNGNINWVTSSATGSDYVFEAEKKITQKAVLETNCNINPIGTLVIAMYGQGKTRGQITELMIEAATNQACATINPYLEKKTLTKYLKKYFNMIYLEIRKLAAGGSQPNLNMLKIRKTIIPLPSLEEQTEIVKKIESLFQVCDELEEQINSSKTNSQTLMQSVLKEAFEK
jgi:type I restriction enzyme S subunit